ncbi:MAG: hypothetical protein ABIH86_02260 [Planctomycetota bacterium]
MLRFLSSAGLIVLSLGLTIGCNDDAQTDGAATDTTAASSNVLFRGMPVVKAPDSRVIFMPTVRTERSLAQDTRLRLDMSVRELNLKSGQPSEPVYFRFSPYNGVEPLRWGPQPLVVNLICDSDVQCSALQPMTFNGRAGTDSPVEFAVIFYALPGGKNAQSTVRLEVSYDVEVGQPESSIIESYLDIVELDVRIPLEIDETLPSLSDDDAVILPVVDLTSSDAVSIPVKVAARRTVLTFGMTGAGTDDSGAAFGADGQSASASGAASH